MWSWVDRWAGLLLDASLSATILSSGVALVMLGCRQPTRRAVLARAAILGALALIPMAAWPPLPRVEVGEVLQRAGFLPHPLLLAAPDSRSGAAAAAAGSRSAARSPGAAVMGAGVEPASSLPSIPARRGLIGRAGRWTARLLALAYLAGVSVSLAWVVLGCWGLGWLTRRSTAPASATQELYQGLPFPGGRARPRLRVTARVHRPVVSGIVRQTILIPPELDHPGAAEHLRLGLLHELAHAQGCDPWFSLAGSLAQAFWFFVPPVWWIRAQMRLDHEFLADHRAAVAFGAGEAYALSLLELAAPRPAPSSSRAAAAPHHGGTGSALFQRVSMLVQCPFPLEPTVPGWCRRSLPWLVALATLAASCLSVRGPSAQPARGVGAQPPRTFRMARLVVDPAPLGPDGRAQPIELPVRLPERFDLTLDVWADPHLLPHIRVAGIPLGLAAPPSHDPDPPLSWSHVRIRRDDRNFSLWIDDRPVAVAPVPLDIPNWLALEPAPGRPCSFQNLRLHW
jgi:hypothetical protein